MKPFKFIADMIRSNTGVSHKRGIAVIFALSLILDKYLLMFVAIPENNVSIFNQIVYIFGGVILYQTGASVMEKVKKVDKKENTDENNFQ
jgi:hypothetical protein